MPPGCCKCKYCSPGGVKFSQKELNKELEDGVLEAINNEKKRCQAQREGEVYVHPLEEVYLKAVPGSG